MYLYRWFSAKLWYPIPHSQRNGDNRHALSHIHIHGLFDLDTRAGDVLVHILCTDAYTHTYKRKAYILQPNAANTVWQAGFTLQQPLRPHSSSTFHEDKGCWALLCCKCQQFYGASWYTLSTCSILTQSHLVLHFHNMFQNCKYMSAPLYQRLLFVDIFETYIGHLCKESVDYWYAVQSIVFNSFHLMQSLQAYYLVKGFDYLQKQFSLYKYDLCLCMLFHEWSANCDSIPRYPKQSAYGFLVLSCCGYNISSRWYISFIYT